MKYKFQDGGNTWGQMVDPYTDEEPIDEESTEQSDSPEEDQIESEQDQAYQEDPLYNEFINQDYLNEESDSMSVINMVLSDEVTGKNNDFSLGWLNTKNKSVNIGGTSSKLSQYLNSLPDNIKNELIATSGNDSGVHMKGSKHDSGEAVDFRFNKEVYNYMLNDPLFKQLNLNIPNPNHGTAPHIHLEQREFGGDGNDKKSYNPKLADKDLQFQSWYAKNTVEGKNNIPYSNNLDYDYYSLYRNGDYQSYQGGHFPDTYKRPNHQTFSNESIYSIPENPGGSWQGEKYIPKSKDGGKYKI